MEKLKIIINGENALLGRLASFAAKQALQGKEIIILNSEKVIKSGNIHQAIENLMKKRRRGGSSQRGPNVSSVPFMLVKRAIRGMLPRNDRGRIALKKIKCYNGIPSEFENEKKIKTREKNLEHVSMGYLSRLIKK